jgi:hypothetical protein
LLGLSVEQRGGGEKREALSAQDEADGAGDGRGGLHGGTLLGWVDLRRMNQTGLNGTLANSFLRHAKMFD